MNKYFPPLYSKRYSLIRWMLVLEILSISTINAKDSNNNTISANDIFSSLMSQFIPSFTQNPQGMSPSSNPTKNQEQYPYSTPNNNQNLNNWNNFSFPLPSNASENFPQTPLKLSPDQSVSQQTIPFNSLPLPLQQIYCSVIMILTDSKTTPQKIDEMIAQIPPSYKETFFFIVNNQDQNFLHYYCAAGQGSPAIFNYLIKKLQPIDGMNRTDSQDITPLDLLFRNKRFDLISEFVKTLSESSNSKAEPINKIFQSCFEVLKQNSKNLNTFVLDLKNLIKLQFLNFPASKISKDEFTFLKNILSMLEAQNQDSIKTLLSSDSNNSSLLILAIQQEKIDLANLFVSYIHDFDENELDSILNELNQYIINKLNNKKLKLSSNDSLFQLINSLIKRSAPVSFISAFRTLIESQFLNPQIKEISNDKFTFLKCILSILEKQSQDIQQKNTIEILFAPDSNDISFLALAIQQGKIDFANFLLSYRSHFDEIELSSVLDQLKDYIIRKSESNESKIVINTSLLQLISSIIKECEPSTNFPSSFMHTLVQYASVQQLEQIISLLSSEIVKTLLFETNENDQTAFEIVAFEQQDIAKLKTLLDFIDDHQQCFEIKNKKGENFLQALAYNDANLEKLKKMFKLFSDDLQSSAALALNTESQNMFDIAMESNASNIFKYLFQITIPPKEKLFEWSTSDEYHSGLLALQNNVKRLKSSSYLNSLLDEDGNSLLHIAAANGALQNVRTLINAGIDITSENQEGRNPIRVLIQQMNTKFNKKQTKKKKNNKNNKQKSDRLVLLGKILNQAAASLKSQNGNDEDAFQNFINEQDSESGNTLLHEILQLPLSSNIIKLLKRHNANFTIQNTDGLTPLNIALQSQDEDIIKLLTPPQEDA